ncbi:hypothetical protein QBC46DRAFT_453470 [Diplogelasinospora grovesii]|uniref:Uncharacterized protein n=1 Tax=Diplogelasinospora grovesii TaxID=303347 RepID=A0AAN6MXR4_9PEZI|nr:hypothetical protein QBC46DRAFT_453470 [Diplogelasinospora grovesii]
MEVLGVSASVIAVVQIAGQFGSAVLKLKQLWNQIEDVPERIQDLLDHLDVLDPLVRQIESHFSDTSLPQEIWDKESTRLSMTYCRGAISSFQDLVLDMSNAIKTSKALKRRVICTKIMLKQDTIKSLERKMKKAIQMLDLSIQCYQLALHRANYETRASLLKVVSENVRPTDPVISTVSTAVKDKDDDGKQELPPVKYTRKGCGNSHLRSKSVQPTYFGRLWVESSSDGNCRHWFFQPPSWLATRVWEAELRTACSGWQQFGAVRCYNVRRSNELIFEYIREGRMEDLLQLFQSRQASPFDRDEYGSSLIRYAARYNHLKICQALLTFGLDICLDEKPENGGLTAREITATSDYAVDTPSEYLEEKIAIMNLFRNVEYYHYSPSDTLEMLVRGLTRPRGYSWKANELGHFQRLIVPSYYQLPLKSRLEAIRRVVQGGWDALEADFPNILRTLLREDRTITAEDVTDSIREGLSLLHTIALGFSAGCSPKWILCNLDKTHIEQRLPVWERCISDVLQAVAMDRKVIHSVETVSLISDYSRKKHEDDLEPFPKKWIGTPLTALLYGVRCEFIVGSGWKSQTHECLAWWLGVLKACGVDLEQYGRTEREIYQHLRTTEFGKLRREVHDQNRWAGGSDVPVLLVELREIKYGREPEEWELQWDIIAELGMMGKMGSEADRARREKKKKQAWYSDVDVPGGWVD